MKKQSDKEENEKVREVLREPGQISFKEAMKKVVNQKPKKKEK